MQSQIRTLTKIIKGLQFEQIPKERIEKVKMCLADTIACAFDGSDLPWAQNAIKYAKKYGAEGDSPVWTAGITCDSITAAQVNGMIAHSTLMDDMHIMTYSHPGTVIIPAALSACEKKAVSGKKLILAILGGYEAMLRIGTALHTKKYEATSFRPSGSFGPFGSAAAAALILGLSEDEIVSALGLAGNTCGGFRRFGMEGSNDVYYQNGTVSRNGLVSAYMAQMGFVGSEFLLEGRGGYAVATSGDCDWSIISKANGEEWEIDTVYFKPVAGCSAVITAAQLALDMSLKHDINPDDVERIVLYTHNHGKITPGCDYGGPFLKMNQAQFSNQYAISCAIVDHNISFSAYKDFSRESIGKFAPRIEVVVDERVESEYPAKKPAGLDIYLSDGTVLHGWQDDIKLVTAAQVYEKLEKCVSAIKGSEQAMLLVDAVRNLEKLSDASDLLRLL